MTTAMIDFRHRKRTKSDTEDGTCMNEDGNVAPATASATESTSASTSAKGHDHTRSSTSGNTSRHDYHIAIISLLLLIPVYLLCSIQDSAQLAETLSSFTESS
eukprot:CAMPEP_0119025250 /NCGR_PEP_ID=MMETSP1176-20130426/33404_1 /TAXON_ID=265551 /ORGANISM="Synedropsis recta cf, Strain CCMP1620" /LENGTH=102 /DNA_ID=CAMNT_0006980747 /DNA_START=8 /DNA_END=312 /DNA_ORIENTATION=+